VEVDDVIAHAVYDPVARRQRYLKSRQLKGRQKNFVPPPPKVGQGSRVVDAENANSSLHVNRTAAIQAASTARQAAAIRGRLSDLKAHLAELLAQKKAAATSSSKTASSKTAAKKTASTPAKPKTAKQKAAAKQALKKAQATRAKTQKAVPNKKPAPTSLTLDEQITKTRAVITDVETKLRAVVDSARTQTASNGR
jgi:hypothetical protein